MAERNDARIQVHPWLERLAWNAAAAAALAVMLLVLLASLEWLDQLSAPSRASGPPPASRTAVAPEACETPTRIDAG